MINNLGYNGIVKISITQGNRTLITNTYHNKGNISLFKFIGYCLAGEYNAAKILRPCKVGLFHNNSITPAAAEIANPLSEDSIIKCSPIIATETDAVVKTEIESNSCSTTIHFRIPYILISNDKVNQAILYNNMDQACAYFLFTTPEGNWKYILEETQNKSAYTLVIEWTLIISNKEDTNTTSATETVSEPTIEPEPEPIVEPTVELGEGD